MPLVLTWNDATRLPVEADGLRPEVLAGLSVLDVSRLRLPLGNTSVEVGELFHVEGTTADGHLIMEGDLRCVRAVGAGMRAGAITVRGDVGARVGLGMSGGWLVVEGSAGAWAGAEMAGGLLQIVGDAGSGLGSALPGSRRGMTEGVILVGGSAGDDVGVAMRRGFIAVRGRVGQGAGRWMIAGSLFAFGAVGPMLGLGMRRGTIALFGQTAETSVVLPTFVRSGRDRPPVLTIYLRHLVGWGFDVPAAVFSGRLTRYNGDRADRGQGEVLVWGETPT
jgi:formylmethanofuran dehydrogenase subunit C